MQTILQSHLYRDVSKMTSEELNALLSQVHQQMPFFPKPLQDPSTLIPNFISWFPHGLNSGVGNLGEETLLALYSLKQSNRELEDLLRY